MAITNKTLNNYIEKIAALRDQITALEKELKPLEAAAKKAMENRCLESYEYNGHGYKLISSSRKSYDNDLINEICPQAISLKTTTCYRYH